MDFRFYTMKHKVMDHFLLKVVKEAKLKSGKEYVRIAYGNGYFLSSGKGEKIAAPNFLMYKRAKRIFGNRMNVVDEGFTSKCCSNCGANNKISILQDIYDEKKKVKGKKWFAVRGLKHCEVWSNFYDRDHNAALNIVRNALMAPFQQILTNAGLKPSDIYKDGTPIGHGYNLKTGKMGDLIQMGVIDPLKVTRCALQNAVSVAVTILSTNAIITMARTYEQQ
jgi:hypothetical protein